jgi:poly(A) polymerase
MIRAARFVAQLDVRPADRVVESMRALADRLAIVSAERIRDELDKLLVGEHAPAGLALLVDTGLADRFLPELPALSLEQDPVHRHKDVLRHTYAVVDRCEPDLVLRLAALLHDVGKPATRKITPEGVTFHHHEVEGARIARMRLTELRYPRSVIDDVCTLIELHLRFHGYGDSSWSDAAVRRFVRDAGPLLDRLNQLTRADVTTRNEKRAEAFAKLQDELEERIAVLAEQENLEAMRPPLDGRQVMEVLGLEPGPEIGQALAFLMELRLERGPIPEDEAIELLRAWAAGP